jgi:hypothetical protein
MQIVELQRNLLDTARVNAWVGNELLSHPELVSAEEELMIAIAGEIEKKTELSPDDINNLFTFVFGKAAEVVTNMYNHQPDKFELTGMLGGQIPVYADDAITEKFKTSGFPAACAENYLNWNEANATLIAATDPVLLLFEAIKWCFRLSCSYAVSIVEENKEITGEN